MPIDPSVAGGNDPRVKAAQELRQRILRQNMDPAQAQQGAAPADAAATQGDAAGPAEAQTEVAPLLKRVLEILVKNKDPNDLEQVRQFFLTLQSMLPGQQQQGDQPDGSAASRAEALAEASPKSVR